MKKENKKTSTDKKANNDSNKTGLIAGVVVLMLIGLFGLGFAFKDKIRETFSAGGGGIPSRITKEEMELLVKDFPPQQLKAMSDNPEQKKQLIDNIKELLAIANQAQKDGLANDPLMKQELQSINESILAISYDQKINSEKGPMPPFSSITEEQVENYWKENAEAKEKKFKDFIDTKIALAKKSGQIPEGQEPSEEEINQAKGAFAKTQIYYNEAKEKLASLGTLPEEERKEWEELQKKVALQTKLQKAQILTQTYFKDVLEKKLEVTEEEVAEYLKENPDLTNSEEKKKKAEEVLEKVKSGGDFAKLADEHSEDPGTKGKGGLYEGIGKGQFDPKFEEAAMALEPGETAKELVKTNFGYHIIQLIKKGESKDAEGKSQPTFDVRHILFSTMIKDPDNPMAREMPAEEFIKSKLEKEKQEKILEDIKAKNPIQVAEDFEIPTVSEEELKKMQEEQMKQMQQMQQMQQGPAGEGGKDDSKEIPKEASKDEPKEDDEKK